MEGNKKEGVVAEEQEPVDRSSDLEEQDDNISNSDSMEDRKSSSCSPDFEENKVNEPLESSHIIEDTIENELPNNTEDGDLSLSDTRWLEGDGSVALWVKWRGRWQVGIRCSRADWPLSTVRGKPTHDRKKYFVIFFPHTRNYSWADTLLVRPISDYPHPIAYRTHKSGLKLVRDLTVARRYIMKKVAIGMLNIIDQFHMEALAESAQDLNVWKEFAMEASQCNGYPELGKMLLKLHNMILRKFINPKWLEQPLISWKRRCQNVETAEMIEMLKEELYDSILWNEIKSLWDAPVQPILGSERRTWKQEVMKWFSSSHLLSVSGSEIGLPNSSSAGVVMPDLQGARKRPKLEIRRAETHASPLEANISSTEAVVEIDSDYFKGQDSATPQPCLAGQPMVSPSCVTERWEEMATESRKADSKLTTPESTRMNQLVVRNHIESGSKSRQCAAFIESKGRQCVRSANEGDIYCCVHLASRFLGSSAPRAERAGPDSPLCGGTTVLGTRCKHRSLPGSTFCKKHRPRDDSRRILDSPKNMPHKRKHEEIVPSLENPFSKALVVVGPVENSLEFEDKPEHSGGEYFYGHAACCIGSGLPDGTGQCVDTPKRYSLYCDVHLPSWLKRARNGKSRIVSKEVFIELLGECSGERQKVNLHKACELFFRLFKSVLSLRNPVPTEVQLQWALSEASKEPHVGNFLLKIVSSEKERLERIWGFGQERGGKVTSSTMEEHAVVPWSNGVNNGDVIIKCKICLEDFLNDQALGTHWMEDHKKEAKWHFRGYACAICLDSYTSKKTLESHVQERHHVQFVEQCKLLQCIPCHGHFGNVEELWAHVISVHPANLRLAGVFKPKISTTADVSPSKANLEKLSHVENKDNNVGDVRKYVCRFCGLKFELLPDLGRHHQAAHMDPSLASSRPTKKGIRYYAYKLKSGRLSRPRFKKGLGSVSYRMRNRGSTASLKKRMQFPKSATSMFTGFQPHISAADASGHGRLNEPQCSTIAKILFSRIQKTKSRPSNQDIFSVARSSCCKERINTTLEAAYGEVPERLYLKAAKFCSEQNIPVNWHRESFICPNSCGVTRKTLPMSPLVPPTKGLSGDILGHSADHSDAEWEVDESHYVVDFHQFKSRTLHNAIILCGDISFGRESAPVTCVVDEWLLDSLYIVDSDGHNRICSMPWASFTYITKPLVDQSVGVEIECHQLGCACGQSVCSPEACDHVYLFDNDYEDAKDIYGKSMRGRFPYDKSGRIILEEGYLVYECNHLCSCSKGCSNRTLQNGVQVKLEVFKTEKKGWGLRAGEAILRGTFICEYAGEVIDEIEGDERRSRYGRGGSNYLYDINSQINDMSRLIEGEVRYVIDSTKYGNVSRFINHSCSPNLVNHQVLVESMDCQRAHIGLYANRDITVGEELTYDYRYELLPGEGQSCYCESTNCRGRLY
ncbi:hypothetical protein SAY86_031685 [Trapa natans]|uniref:Histone-lysine N-methyltransferase SUVR5 n=1 Tax=Trapa natans TaxID=22666 RepID=A0AAN7M3N4_TRANT|nr:hypothetical protein SAY86_031685 [Trapa natans]